MVTRRTAKSGSAARNRRETVLPTVAKLTSKGQITIPKDVRDDLGLHSGDALTFTRRENGVYAVTKQLGENPFERWRGSAKDLVGVDVDELLDEWRGR